jgi:hypothetical protein
MVFQKFYLLYQDATRGCERGGSQVQLAEVSACDLLRRRRTDRAVVVRVLVMRQLVQLLLAPCEVSLVWPEAARERVDDARVVAAAADEALPARGLAATATLTALWLGAAAAAAAPGVVPLKVGRATCAAAKQVHTHAAATAVATLGQAVAIDAPVAQDHRARESTLHPLPPPPGRD